MPIHDYKCPECDKIFEDILRRITDDSDELCPECNSVMERLIGNTSFAIRGYAPTKAFKSANKLRKKNEKHKK